MASTLAQTNEVMIMGKNKKEAPAGGYFRSTFTYEGKRYARKSKDSQREADRKADALLASLKRGEVGISSNMTVKAWAKEWLETYKRPAVGEGQYENYLTHINGVIVPAIGKFQLKDVKDVDLQKILNSRAGKSLSDISKLRRTLNAIFDRARKSKLIGTNPAQDLETPAATDGTHRSITEIERKAILTLAETHYAGLWVKTLLYCGVRPGETRALDWRHIDFSNKLIHVQLANKARTNMIGTPKSDAGVRDVPIPDKLLPDLKAERRGPFEPVFVQPTTGKRHTKSSMTCLWNNFKRELDISMGAKVYRNKIIISLVADDLVPYCLRHTYCTDLQDAGVPINVAKYLMGHSDISLTAKIYTHTTAKAIKNAAELINAPEKENTDDSAETNEESV